jgi:kynurenine formamidase
MRIVDLSLPINRHMPGIPTIPEYEKNPTRCLVTSALSADHLDSIRAKGIETVADPATAGIMTSRVEIATHIGTHIDAPIHFVPDSWTIDQVPLERIVKKGRVIPLTHIEPFTAVTADAVLATGVDFDESVIPVLHTGWTDRTYGTDSFWHDMIYLDTSAAELMVERGVSAVALDFFPEVPFWRLGRDHDEPGPNHVTLLGNETIIIQMLTNIGAIEADDFTLVGVPLLLEGLDGSPARVFAMVE